MERFFRYCMIDMLQLWNN